jgi:predicted dinucleotide-binding enzyme
MEIGVLGMGRVAQTLARSWAATGHRAMVRPHPRTERDLATAATTKRSTL